MNESKVQVGTNHSHQLILIFIIRYCLETYLSLSLGNKTLTLLVYDCHVRTCTIYSHKTTFK